MIENLLAARRDGPFTDLFDFCARTDPRKVNRRAIEALIRSGAFDSLGVERWVLMASLDDAQVSPAVVLDLGCGTGYFQPELRSRYPGASCIGLDLAPGMVEYARAHAAGGAHWLVGDAESLPLAADSVDLVFSSFQQLYLIPTEGRSKAGHNQDP